MSPQSAIKNSSLKFVNVLIMLFISIICIAYTVCSIVSINTAIKYLTPREVEHHIVIDDEGNFVDASSINNMDNVSSDSLTYSTPYQEEQIIKHLVYLKVAYICFIALVFINWIILIVFRRLSYNSKFYIVSVIFLVLIILIEVISNHHYIVR